MRVGKGVYAYYGLVQTNLPLLVMVKLSLYRPGQALRVPEGRGFQHF